MSFCWFLFFNESAGMAAADFVGISPNFGFQLADNLARLASLSTLLLRPLARFATDQTTIKIEDKLAILQQQLVIILQ